MPAAYDDTSTPLPAGPHTHRLARLGLLIALAGAVQAAESLVPSPAPWFRLGLGNAVVLVVLHRWGPREGVWVAAGKVLVGSLLAGRLFSPAFLLSLGGTAAAAAAMAAALRASPPLGFVGISVLGAQAHVLAQLFLATLLLRTPALWSLLPLLGTLAVLAGCLTGFVAHRVVQVLGCGGGMTGRFDS
ncbi:MAG: Gx transporter family protein [Thermodesulfobacteriota bacterium]